MKYKDKDDNEIVEAIQFIGNFDEIEDFVGGDAESRGGKLLVATPDGPLWANNWDYIIKRRPNMFTSMSPKNFNQCFTPWIK
jgi:hypothetical protein